MNHESHGEAIPEGRVEAVGKLAFRILCKVIADGLPKLDEVTDTWFGGEYLSRALTDEETPVLAKLALYIEQEAHLAALSITSEQLTGLIPGLGVVRRPRSRGRPRKQEEPKSRRSKAGAPRKWTRDAYAWLIIMAEIGHVVGNQSTDRDALTWALEKYNRRWGQNVRKGRIKSAVMRTFAKRLSDARLSLGKEYVDLARERAIENYEKFQLVDT